MTGFLPDLAAALEEEGLNHVGVVSRVRYDAAAPPDLSCAALCPEARSVVVVASGGRRHWDRMLGHVARDPVRHLARTKHPLDDFGKSVFARLFALLRGCAVIHPHHDAPVLLPFMRLGELAGLGRPSEIGIIVSERFGPWIGFRAAVFAPHALAEGTHARRMCDDCPAPCRTACPAGVVGDWDFPWDRCVAFRQLPATPCHSSCAARVACVVAPDQAYSPLQRLYHMNRRAGRAELHRMFSVSDEVGV